MMMIIDHSLSTEVPLDLHQGAEKSLDHDGPHRLTTIFVSYCAVKKPRTDLEISVIKSDTTGFFKYRR
jgi:hypothetical protein